jgi:hypothetical protein
VEGAQASSPRQRFKEISAPTIIALRRQRRGESSAPSTTLRSLRELRVVPLPANAVADESDRSRDAVLSEFVDAKWVMIRSFLGSLSFFPISLSLFATSSLEK